MRDFEVPGRSCARSLNGMAATSHTYSTLTAINILQKGGNALDAAVAACAVQNVVEPGSTGIGGDCFALMSFDGSSNILAYNGSGRAPMGVDTKWYLDQGWAKTPQQTPHCVTVPGAVEAWGTLIKDHGTMDLGELLQPAINFAENGYVVAERVASDWKFAENTLKKNENAARIFLKDGKAYNAGEIHHQKELAKTLKQIADHGPEEFYSGSIAKDIVEYLQSLGGFHTLEDFKRTKGDYQTPIQTKFRGYEVVECGPNGQGIIALMILNILSGFDVAKDPLSVERLHLEIEATRLAYAYRDSMLADPKMADVPVDWLLSEELASQLRDKVNFDKASVILQPPIIPHHKNTVFITVVDNNRMAVSFINSLFYPFGSGLVTPKTGVLLQNRARGFALKGNHPNVIEPGKRPMHTLIPGMLTKDGKVQMSFGVMGGHYQAMGHANLITKYLDYNLDIQRAIEVPRVFPSIGSPKVEAELTIPKETLKALENIGHKIFHPSSGPIGGAQGICIDHKTGVLTGGSDHRKDGCALGY